MAEVSKEVPKIVRHWLNASSARTAPDGTHPDSDLLTAFSEQALSGRERAQIIDHLAGCIDCRDAVVLALPAEDFAGNSRTVGGRTEDSEFRTSTGHIFSFAHSMRWAAPAAVAVVVVASALLVHNRNSNPMAKPIFSHSSTETVATNQPQASDVPSPQSSNDKLAASTKATEVPLKSESQSTQKSINEKRTAFSSKRTPGTMVVMAEAKESEDHDSTEVRANETVEVRGPFGPVILQAQAPAAERTDAAFFEVDESPNQPSEVSAEVDPAPATPVYARMRPGASAPMASSRSGAPAWTPVNSVKWTITAGVLERSMNAGRSWQKALRADRALLCYISHNTDVWTGGQAGALFHSIDGGMSWVQVRPSVRAHPLRSDVVHLDLHEAAQGGQEIVVATSNNEVLSSTDGGRSWDTRR